MSKRTSTLIFILIIIIIIVISIIANSCTVYTSYSEDPIHSAWKAEQHAQNEALLKYTQSVEFKKLYGGKNPMTYSNSPKANSVIGTSNDPFAGVKNSTNIPSSVNTQHYRVTIR